MNHAWIVYLIIALVLVVSAGVVWASIDRKRSRNVATDQQRLDQPDAARRNSPR